MFSETVAPLQRWQSTLPALIGVNLSNLWAYQFEKSGPQITQMDADE